LGGFTDRLLLAGKRQPGLAELALAHRRRRQLLLLELASEPVKVGEIFHQCNILRLHLLEPQVVPLVVSRNQGELGLKPLGRLL
jgi:hypothetical protein